MGVVGAVELWRVVKEGVSPDDVETLSAIDTVIASRLSRRDAPKPSSWMETEYPYIAAVGVASFTVFSCVIKRCIMRFCFCKSGESEVKKDEGVSTEVHPSTNSSPGEVETCLSSPADPQGPVRKADTSINSE